jgi:environmental stress-induced protein Ves
MENTSSYLALEGMLQQGWVFMSFAELERTLCLLEKKGLITCVEHQALNELARKLGMDKLPDG